MGQAETGFTVLAEALALVEEEGVHYSSEAELYRLKGELLLRRTVPDVQQAESCFHQAITIARSQQARSLQLRAVTSLACLWQEQGKRQDARDLLAPVYNCFTEGFDTADLQDAKVLLKELAG
jgi:predicted ATPase